MIRFVTLLIWLVLQSTLPVLAQRANASLNMPLRGRWQDPASNIYYSEIWGYAAPDGREYALLGSTYGINIVEVTNPAAPRLIQRLPGRIRLNVRHRDIKTYDHYAYAVADGALQHSLQIYDLQYLPDSVHLVYDSDSLTRATHTIFIDGTTLYLADNNVSVNDSTVEARPLDILSLANPERPRFLRTLRWSRRTAVRAHAVYAHHDTAFISSGFQGMWFYDMRNPLQPQPIDSLQHYPSGGYNHSSWRSPSGRLMVVADELPEGLPLKLFDIGDINNPVFLSRFNSLDSLATPHNPFFVTDRYVVASWYHDGVQVWDVANPTAPVRVGYFDTYPDNDSTIQRTGYNGFAGCWGVYPLLPSGNIIASDITYGLFVLAPPYSIVTAASAPAMQKAPLLLSPNPATSSVWVQLAPTTSGTHILIRDALGREVLQTTTPPQTAYYELCLTSLGTGIYSVQTEAVGQPCHQTRLVIAPH